MGRLKHKRIIARMPYCVGFKPINKSINQITKNILLVEEYESIRLLDYEGLSQEDAAMRMGVSRPTLTRIYMKARRTLAKTLVESSALLIEGGDFEYRDQIPQCPKCKKFYSNERASHRCPKPK